MILWCYIGINNIEWQDFFCFRSLVSAHEGHVEDIRFDSSHGRIVTVGQGAIQVWKVEPEGVYAAVRPNPLAVDSYVASLSAVWGTMPRKDYIARAVSFCDDGASVVVFYLESHEM